MTVREFAEIKIRELQFLGNKNVVLKSIRPCELGYERGYRSVSCMLFDPTKVPESAEVLVDHKPAEGTKVQAADIYIGFVPPRCRKESTKSYYAALA